MIPRCCYQCYTFGLCFPILDYKDCIDCKDKLNCKREICLGFMVESQTDWCDWWMKININISKYK